MVVVNIISGILLVGGLIVAYAAGRDRPGVPEPGWYSDGEQERFWDGRAWTTRVRESEAVANRGRRFKGRFWGPWAWWLLGAVAVLIAGSIGFSATGSVNIIAAASFLSMAGICWAFYRFTARQLALDGVISRFELLSAMVATGGAVILIASNANSAIINGAGITIGLGTVGFIEEGTKLLVPLALYALGRYRDPRAGVALGMGSGFAFAIVETTQYAYSNAESSGPGICGGQTVQPTAQAVIEAQVLRIFTVSPLHWLWIGIATAIAWRLWHLYGAKGTPGAVAAILAVMVVHSVNDSSAQVGCNNAGLAFLSLLFRWALLVASYLVFKAMARKSTPPELIGAVSKGWTPMRLPTYTRERAFASEE